MSKARQPEQRVSRGRRAPREEQLRFERVATKLAQRYWRLSRALTLGTRAMVFDGASRVLLIRHTYTRGWHFPGGGVEFGETVHDSLCRELDEEAGVTLTGTPELMGVYANFARFPGDHVIMFVVREWRQARPFAPNREIAEARFCPLDALPPDITEGTRRRIDELVSGGVRQADW